MIRAHRAGSQLLPRIPIGLVPVQRTADGIRERGRLVLREGEAVALRIRVHVADRGGESTDRAHDRDRSVAERDELSETAGLEPRGHEEEIRTGIDPLRQSRVETERQREASLVLRGEVTPLLLVGRVTGAEDDELPAFLEKPRLDCGEEVHALLLDEPADDAEDRSRRVDRQAGLLLERGLVDRLPVLVVRVEAGGDVRIVRWIEELRVDAVGDAPEIAAALAEKSLQALAE